MIYPGHRSMKDFWEMQPKYAGLFNKKKEEE